MEELFNERGVQFYTPEFERAMEAIERQNGPIQALP
jgi:hypothetical protein